MNRALLIDRRARVRSSARPFAWCDPVVLTFAICYEVFCRYVLRRADRLGVRRQLHALRHAVHDGRRLHARPQRPCARRFPLSQLVAAAGRRQLDLVLYFLFFFPGIIAFIYAGCGFAKMSWLMNEHSSRQPERPADLAVQSAHPHHRRADAAAGHRRGRALHHLHPHGRMAAAPARRRGAGEAHPGARRKDEGVATRADPAA